MSQIIMIKNISGEEKIWGGKKFLANEEYQIEETSLLKWRKSTNLILAITAGEALIGDGSSYFTSFVKALEWLQGNHQEVFLRDVSVENGRLQNMNNRVPNGFSLYVTGVSDNISSGTFGNGEDLFFSSSKKVIDFRQLCHYYAIGARTHWNADCDIDNYFKAELIAPACSGATQAVGDFIKIPITGGNMFKPVLEGSGDWDMDLTNTLTGTSILKATPVPSEGNQGWFDYVSDTNILTPNYEQKGGYNLFDFDITLHFFGRKIWGIKNGVSSLDVSDLIGKLLFNSWTIRLTFDIQSGLLGSEKAGVLFILATKGNV